MHITVAGKQVDTGEALRTHVREELEAITAKYFDHALEAHVTFHHDGKPRAGASFACDINLKAGRGLMMRGEGHGPDAHRAFDQAAEHVGKRLRRYRRRVNEHSRSGAEERHAVEAAQYFVVRHADEPEESEPPAPTLPALPPPSLVSEGETAIHRLTVAEAVMRLDLGGLPVLLFRNAESGAINLVYRRADAQVGWIATAGA